MSQQKPQAVRVYEAWPLKKDQWSCPDRGEIPAAVTAHQPVLSPNPFAVPAQLDAGLNALRIYWHSLKRGNAAMPFADDWKLGEAGQLSKLVFLAEVFETPERFRLNIVGDEIAGRYGSELTGKFADEIAAHVPLNFFLSQCAATVEIQAPTFYRHAPAKRDESEYERIVFPLWADGRIGALFGAIHFQQ